MSAKEKNTPPAPKKAKNDKRDNDTQSKLKRWLREMKSELSKVQWPSKKDTTKHTITVLCCVGLIGAFIWVYDFLATNVVEALIALS